MTKKERQKLKYLMDLESKIEELCDRNRSSIFINKAIAKAMDELLLTVEEEFVNFSDSLGD